MRFTIFLALTLMPIVARADDDAPHAVAVAVAHAQIVAAVRFGEHQVSARHTAAVSVLPLQALREAPCPEAIDQPCRMLILDMQ